MSRWASRRRLALRSSHARKANITTPQAKVPVTNGSILSNGESAVAGYSMTTPTSETACRKVLAWYSNPYNSMENATRFKAKAATSAPAAYAIHLIRALRADSVLEAKTIVRSVAKMRLCPMGNISKHFSTGYKITVANRRGC